MFEQKFRERVMETNTNYELVMKDLISHLFLPRALRRQKRYLRRGMYKPRDTNIQDCICFIYNMVEYLENFPPLWAVQRLPEDEILDLVEFSLSKEW